MAQFARPISDITTTEISGSYTAIDEVSFSDADYLTSNDNTDATYEALLSTVVDPQLSGGHIIRLRWGKSDTNVAPNASGNTQTGTAYLYQGATLIATLGTNSNLGNFVTLSYTLSSTETNNITDYSDLRIRVVFPTSGGGNPGNRRGGAISWFEFEVPDLVIDTETTLNTADAFSFTTATPSLEFTGTDLASTNSLTYEIDIVSDYGEVTSYGTENYTTYQFMQSGFSTGFAQSFTGDGKNLYNCSFYIYQTATLINSLYARLYAHSGTYGTSGVPTGSVLAESSIPVDIITNIAPGQVYTFDFDGTYELINGTNYFIAIEYTEASGNIRCNTDFSSPSHSGNMARRVSGTWSVLSTDDLIFYVNGATPEISKKSNIDSGFTNTINGGDTDPFNEDEKISYTVQGGDALADGTYYWTARSKAPSGLNVFSNKADFRSFTINTSSPAPRRIFNIN